MREIPLANCAKEFIQNSASQKQRLDCRPQNEYRKIRIEYGLDHGCCQVHIGDTRVLAQVSSEVIEPKLHRPTDGVLYINVEMSPMTSPSVEFGRPSDHCVEIQRILERTLKESRCLDLESLCIVSSKQVWQIRVDVHCLNNAGDLLDACSIAGIAALAHFKLPDVTIEGENVTIHSLTERDPIPLSLHHMPICTTFAFFSQGKVALVDPSLEEERVMEGKLVVGMNKHREICCLQSAGSMLLTSQQVMRCSNIAVQKVGEITKIVQSALENDSKARVNGEKCGFAESEPVTEKLDVTDADKLKSMIGAEAKVADEEMIAVDSSESEDERTTMVSSQIGEGGPSSWDVDDEEMKEVLNATDKPKNSGDQHGNPDTSAGNYSLDSDGEEIGTLAPDSFDFKIPEVSKKPKPDRDGKKKRKKRP